MSVLEPAAVVIETPLWLPHGDGFPFPEMVTKLEAVHVQEPFGMTTTSPSLAAFTFA